MDVVQDKFTDVQDRVNEQAAVSRRAKNGVFQRVRSRIDERSALPVFGAGQSFYHAAES